MAESTAAEIVTAYQDAWTKRDFEMAGRYVAEDIVFHSPQQHITGTRDFLSMLSAFAERIDHRWERLEATTDGDGVLILYNLFLDGVPAVCADYFTVRDGKIRSETLVFDPKPFMAAASKRQQAVRLA